MAKNLLYEIMIAVLIVLGLLFIWKLVLPFLGIVIGDVFGGTFVRLVGFLGSLF